MTGHRTLPGAEGRLRVTPWRGDPAVAHLTPAWGRATSVSIDRCLTDLERAGYHRALTSALPVTDQAPFLACGFEVHERLRLLRRPIDRSVRLPEPTADLRRPRSADRPAILAADAAAFPTFWRLDEPGLQEAMAATPSARLRVALAPDQRTVVGYAVTGRAGPRGYLQRLAVHPSAQGRGLGADLVHDGLRWLRRWGASEALVNTQEENAAALRLYRRLGFREQDDGLVVLHRHLAGTA
ncbi:MAG: GNAT family N-acetyltransferase [Acidimicrobiales bacterium]